MGSVKFDMVSCPSCCTLRAHLCVELEHGPLSALEARDRRNSGGYPLTAVYVDAKSVYAATIATFIKQPAEKSLLCHLQYLRELRVKNIVSALLWVDTRDMGADGLTKGAASRGALHETCQVRCF